MSLFLFPQLRVLSMTRKFTRALAVCSVLLAGSALAQTEISATPSAMVSTASAFKNFKPFTDEPISNWKAANDEVARIGGWREYARQSQETDNDAAPAVNPASAVKAPDVLKKSDTKVTP